MNSFTNNFSNYTSGRPSKNNNLAVARLLRLLPREVLVNNYPSLAKEVDNDTYLNPDDDHVVLAVLALLMRYKSGAFVSKILRMSTIFNAILTQGTLPAKSHLLKVSKNDSSPTVIFARQLSLTAVTNQNLISAVLNNSDLAGMLNYLDEDIVKCGFGQSDDEILLSFSEEGKVVVPAVVKEDGINLQNGGNTDFDVKVPLPKDGVNIGSAPNTTIQVNKTDKDIDI